MARNCPGSGTGPPSYTVHSSPPTDQSVQQGEREAIITQLVNRSAKADLRAIKILLDIIQDIERRTEPTSPETSFGLADQKVIEQLKARLNDAK